MYRYKDSLPHVLISAVNGVGSFVAGFLVLRFLLKLLGASAVAPFVQWVYAVTDPLLAPFAGMFPSPALERGLALEFNTLFAIVAYSFVFYLITSVLSEIEWRTARRYETNKVTTSHDG